MKAEELLNSKVFTPYGKVDNDTVLELMIEFATYHVELAKKEIDKYVHECEGAFFDIQKNCYPIENIK